MAALGIPAGAGQRDRITPAEQIKRMQAPMVEEIGKVLGNRNIAKIVAQYVAQYYDDSPRWYTALKRIGMLPPQIPSLPQNINQILNEKCPIYAHQQKPDETPLEIWQTHSLYLIPPGTINQLEARVSAYGKEHLNEYGGRILFDSDVLRTGFARNRGIFGLMNGSGY